VHGSHGTIGWSFAPAYDPKTKRYVAAIEVLDAVTAHCVLMVLRLSVSNDQMLSMPGSVRQMGE
jgi:hypothetical protein